MNTEIQKLEHFDSLFGMTKNAATPNPNAVNSGVTGYLPLIGLLGGGLLGGYAGRKSVKKKSSTLKKLLATLAGVVGGGALGAYGGSAAFDYMTDHQTDINARATKAKRRIQSARDKAERKLKGVEKSVKATAAPAAESVATSARNASKATHDAVQDAQDRIDLAREDAANKAEELKNRMRQAAADAKKKADDDSIPAPMFDEVLEDQGSGGL